MEYREKIDVNELVAEYVRKCEEQYPPSMKSQKVYKESLDAMKGIVDLRNITEKDIEEIVRSYLYNWGAMQRVLGKSEFQNWQSKLKKAIQSNDDMLEEFRSKDLIEDISPFKEQIKSCYGSFKAIVERVAATKVLHLICPDFFPMWDNAIAEGVRNEFPEKDDKGTRIKAFSTDDYYRFMQVIQDFLRDHENVWSKLAGEEGKSKLRIIDECLYWAVRRPFYLFSFRVA